jgi:large subunit ribosomal protein L21
MYAVIRTGGKQYKVAPEDTLQIEKIEGEAGDVVAFPEVLMLGGEGEPALGAPLVDGAMVSAEVVEQGRGPKIIVFKKRRRQNYRRKQGHRQSLTTIRILEVLSAGQQPARAVTARNAEDGSAPPAKEAKAEGTAKPARARRAPEQGAGNAEAVPESAGEEKKPRARKTPKTAE